MNINININKTLYGLFSADNINISERNRVVEISFISNVSSFPEYEPIIDFYNSFPKRDDVYFVITDPDDNRLKIVQTTTKHVFNEFINNLESEDDLEVAINISKNIENNRFYIYSYDSFISDLQKSSIYELMNKFNNLLKDNNFIHFIVYDKEDFFWRTETLIFSSTETMIEPDIITREDYINMRFENTSCSIFKEFKLLPNDFNIHYDYENNPLAEVFGKIKTIISLIYLSNISELYDTTFNCRINGYKNIVFCSEHLNVSENDTLYKLYKWIYSSSNIVDKLLITRNIFSLYCLNNDADSVGEELFSSVKTNYQLYLKSNVDQYLNAKNSVAGFIVDTVNSISDNISSILSGFKNNAIALLGFLGTVFLVNVVSEQPLDKIFTYDIVRIFEIVIIGSFVYMGICISESKRKYKSIINSYNSLKKNYLDVFSETEIKQIFNEDFDYKSATTSYNKGLNIWIAIWLLFLTSVLVIVEVSAGQNSCYYLIKGFFNQQTFCHILSF